MSTSSTSNKRIAKNTIFLYFRMAIIMIVKLYTSRVLLDVLGINDYGIWNVIAAFVISFSFISSPLTTATQRFLNFEMGKGGKQLNEIFCTSIELFFIIGIVIVLIFETFGVWFINHKMNFAPDKMIVVNWVFQFSILTFFINLIKMSYDAALVASEKMSFYAFFCIIETSLLLAVAFLIQGNLPISKLIAYGFLTTIVTISVLLGYIIYCRKHIPYTKFHFFWNKSLVIKMGSFSGWNLFSGLASMTAMQGLNVMINIFFGVALNAAYGVSMQIRGAIAVIMDNLLKAANPQIVQSYSSGQINRMTSLLFNILKVTYILCLTFMIPLIVNMDFILHIWLGNNIPQYTQQFATLTLLQLLLVCLGNPIDVAIFATGKIRTFQLCLSGTIFLNIIISYIFFKLGYGVIWSFYTRCCVEFLILIVRLLFLKRQLGIKLLTISKKVFLPILLITTISTLGLILFHSTFTFENGWFRILMSCALFIPMTLLLSWYIVLTTDQRQHAKYLLKSKLKWT